MSYQPVEPAQLAFNPAGVPYAPAFDDIYHSDAGGLEQARHVFLAGNNLPRTWNDRKQFVILETGFGLGLNFLATWQAWRDDPKSCARLHFVSIEKHPFTRGDLAQLHARWPQLADLARELHAQWPPLTPGVHRLLLDDGRVTLTLLFGDAATQVRKLSLHADALYLDGFAPAKNPALWDPQFLKAVTRLCKPGATLATWTVAATVRESLAAQRWTLEKRPGFASKRDMLCGRLHEASPPGASAKHAFPRQHPSAIVIGAGIAGSAIAERLAVRKWHVDLLERHMEVASEASGNPAGLLHPMLAKDDNLAARLSRAGYLYALRQLATIDSQNLGLSWQQCGILQLARDAAQEDEQRRTTDTLRFPGDYVAFANRAQAAQKANHGVAAGGWFYPAGAIVNPPSLCRALLARYGNNIKVQLNTEVDRLEYSDGQWHAICNANRVLASAPVIVLANAFDVMRLLPHCPLPLSRLRGQVSALPAGSLPFLRHAICGNGYVTPALLGMHCLGATFDMDDADTATREESHRFNLARLAELLPGDDLPQFDPARLAGRVGFRTMAIDRMPIVGALPDTSQALKTGAQLRNVPRLHGLHTLTALGSRGLCWAPLAAELLAAQLNDEPLPLERDIVNAVDPARFLIRAQRRGIASTARDM